MAFPAAGGPTFPQTLEVAWASARNVAAQIQNTAINLNTQISAGPVSSQTIINACSYLANLNTQLTAVAAVPGIAAYAQAQVNNAALNVASAFTAMQNALVVVTNWIVANFPVDTGNFLQAMTFNASGVVQWSNFTSVQLAPLATLLTALSATIA